MDNSALCLKVGCYPKENKFQNRTWDWLLLWFHARLSDQRNLYPIPNDIIDYLGYSFLSVKTVKLDQFSIGEEFIMNQKWFMAQWSLPSYVSARISLWVGAPLFFYYIRSWSCVNSKRLFMAEKYTPKCAQKNIFLNISRGNFWNFDQNPFLTRDLNPGPPAP